MFGLFRKKTDLSKEEILAQADAEIAKLRDVYFANLPSGNPVAQAGLGEMYRDGIGVPQNDDEAVRLYRLAAEQGYIDAQFELGNLYFSGKCVSQNDTEAFKWFHVAAEQGHDVAQGSVSKVVEIVRQRSPSVLICA
jgi:TPR repeat protein